MKLHLKIFIVIIVVFGLLMTVFTLWEPLKLKYYERKIASASPAEMKEALDGFLSMGPAGEKYFMSIHPDGPKAAELVLDYYDQPGKVFDEPSLAIEFMDVPQGCRRNEYMKYTPLSLAHVAAFNGHLETIRLLSALGAPMDGECHIYIRKPRVNRDDLNNDTQIVIFGLPLHVAAAFADVPTVEFLLSLGLKASLKDSMLSRTALHCAAQMDRIEIAGVLLAKGADINAGTSDPGETPLFMAAENGSFKTARYLVEKGADVNKADSAGRTPLQRAAFFGHADTTRILIENGADVNAASKEGKTAMHWAAGMNRLEIVRMLLARGAEINPVDDRGKNPFYQAACMNHPKMLNFLIANNAEMTAPDSKGRTPLHGAARYGCVENIKILIFRKVDVNPRDCLGMTPLDLAMKYKRDDAATALRSSGAKTGEELQGEAGLLPSRE